MKCGPVRNSLSLLLYGELSFEEEERVEQHLDECESCRQLFQKERALHSEIDNSDLELPSGMLGQCRRDLRIRLREEAFVPRRSGEKQTGWQRWLAGFWPAGSMLRPAGALALIAVGFFGARIVPDDLSPAGGRKLAGLAPMSSRVRFVNPDEQGGIQIVVDETRQRTLSGRLEDESIQQLLLTAVKDSSDPGLRAESMDILKAQCERTEVRQALLHALQHDPNAGVRLKALEGLKPYGEDPETRRVLSHVLLTDENPGVRTQAIDLLVQKKQQDLVGTLQELLRTEDNSYVRLRSQHALREMKASVETF